MSEISTKYSQIIEQEAHLTKKCWQNLDFKEMNNLADQIFETAESSIVLREYNRTYNLTRDETAFESVGAHTNLIAMMVDRALCKIYGSHIDTTKDGYSYREIMEAIRRHDLPENVNGDIPDDGDRDEVAKRKAEEKYQKSFSNISPKREIWFEKKVLQLLQEMEDKSSPTGRLLYVADKAAAIVMALCYDAFGMPPIKINDVSTITEKDRQEMELCAFRAYGSCRASEMWAIDYFKLRRLIDYDDSGFFTALIVIYTLKNYGEWYPWRYADYDNNI